MLRGQDFEPTPSEPVWKETKYVEVVASCPTCGYSGTATGPVSIVCSGHAAVVEGPGGLQVDTPTTQQAKIHLMRETLSAGMSTSHREHYGCTTPLQLRYS